MAQARLGLIMGVTRLDGARGKKQVWSPHTWTWGLSKANVLYWSKYLWWGIVPHLPPPRYAPASDALD